MKRLAMIFFLFLLLCQGLSAGLGPSVAQSGSRLEADLPYGPNPQQRLDLSVPAAKGFPTVLFTHGGSLASGDKADEDCGKVCAPFASAGVGCATMNYRLGPTHAWPAQAEDVAAGVAWLHSNIGSRGGDPDKLFLLGHSSGAMLAAVMGTDVRYLGRHGLNPGKLRGVLVMGSIMWDDELEEALLQHGRTRVKEAFERDPANRIYGTLETFLELWPARHVRRGLPPFLFLIAESEQEQPPVLKTNKKFVEDARALGNVADYKVLPGRTHYTAIRRISEPGDPVFAILLDFVRRFGGSTSSMIDHLSASAPSPRHRRAASSRRTQSRP